MFKNFKFFLLLLTALAAGFLLTSAPALASNTDGTIDLTDKYAWTENVGWLNFGASQGAVHVTDTALTGYGWGENIGWISLNCSNTNSCTGAGGVDYKVANDSQGTLSGYAWSENAGWINFKPTGGGVTINNDGEFSGYAWGENTGWLVFNCATTSSCAGVNYKTKTDWRPQATRTECNNSLDDDGDGRIDYPNDSGCSSLEDNDETNYGGVSPTLFVSVVGGGGAVAVYTLVINDGQETTDNRLVKLKVSGGTATDTLILAWRPDFQESAVIPSQEKLDWDLCGREEICADGQHTVFVRVKNPQGNILAEIYDSIIYQGPKQKPAEKIIVAPPVVKPPITSSEMENLIKQAPAFLRPFLEEIKNFPLLKLNLQQPFFEQLPETLKKFLPRAITGGLPGNLTPELLQKLLPQIFSWKINEIAPPTIPLEKLIPKTAPISLSGAWNLIPQAPLNVFVLSPLPRELAKLGQKFPELGRTFNRVGISKVTDVQKIASANITLPGLTKSVGLPTISMEPGKIALPKGIPLAQLTPQLKAKIPSEVVFAKGGEEMIDYNMALSVNPAGQPEEQISTIVNQMLHLVVKPERKVKSVKGYVVFKSKKPRASSDLPLDSFLASLTFARPALAKPVAEPVQVEEKLVLQEFEYFDPDNDGIYTADIRAPAVDGEYEIITVMDYEQIELGSKEIRLIAVVDPEGYVYEKDNDKETRIPGAIVSLFWLNPVDKQYELWPAKEYQQENSQVTDARGTYAFLVPEGMYYLKVDAPGYLSYDGKPIVVKEGSGIHINIEMKTKYWWLKLVDWKNIALVLVVLLLLYNFYRDKKRERIIKKEGK